ncbi:Y-family DNA polymerase [Desulfitobacterium chlororespirans]|uniref:DNA polymerase IV n=1 Tax=Desulfitobacterium chlororespirans DSM 11544 TaxID=1121395 RepID=A0A1M7UUG6_9FIRM|nr:DNA polymerase IV [Desulfitobacterium chlororespirans]SHN86585.1 DNA polymerase-4 [Desulfitobacterium chlororespirans DSM 11544]
MASRVIMHIDANSAYLSWEAVHRLQHGDSLDLRTVPSVVGGNPETRHGIVLTKSIPAKKFNIKTGETIWEAKAKCPELIIVPPNYSLYMQCSQAFGDVLSGYSPLVEQYSIDEYFVDFSSMHWIYPDPVAAAHSIKNRIRDELGFTVNVGVSSNKLLAKMGSEFQKPDKVHTLFTEEIMEKMWPLSVEELFMVGRATSKKLYDRRIRTIGELAGADPRWLELFLKSHGRLIWNYANGRDASLVRVNRHPVVKSMGNSTTTAFDVDNQREAYLVLLSLVETVAFRIRAAGYCCQLVSISIKDNDFLYRSHQRKLYDPTDCTNLIHRIACELFDELWRGKPLRHLGVSAADLCSNEFLQTSLFDEQNEQQRDVDKTIDSIRKRHGSLAVQRASFLHSGLKPMTGGTGEEAEYPMMSSVL